MDRKNYRIFVFGFGALPITIGVPRSYSRKATERYLKQRLKARFNSLIDAGVYERRGDENAEIELTVSECMQEYSAL